MNVIETHGLTKRYRRKTAVDRLDMTVAAGDIYGFVGKNGSGKSTTMKLVAGLARPTAGEVVLFGDPELGGATPSGFSRIGALIESPGLLPGMTARDNLIAKALALGMTHAASVADDLLELVGLEPHERCRVKDYSLGMKQRLGLALALVGTPDLLLLDEPFNGLDPEATRAMRLTLVRLNHEHGVTIVISSHVLDQLDRVATRFGVISDGRLTAEFTDDELHARCGSSVRLRAAGTERALALLEQALPGATFHAEPDGALVVSGATIDEVSAACFSAGIEVRELSQQERDIEEYFVELMGAGERGRAGGQGGGAR